MSRKQLVRLVLIILFIFFPLFIYYTFFFEPFFEGKYSDYNFFHSQEYFDEGRFQFEDVYVTELRFYPKKNELIPLCDFIEYLEVEPDKLFFMVGNRNHTSFESYSSHLKNFEMHFNKTENILVFKYKNHNASDKFNLNIRIFKSDVNQIANSKTPLYFYIFRPKVAELIVYYDESRIPKAYKSNFAYLKKSVLSSKLLTY